MGKNAFRADGSARGGSAVAAATDLEPLLDEHEVAALLKWKVATLRRRRWAGLPPEFVKIGETVRYEPRVIRALIAAGRVEIPTT